MEGEAHVLDDHLVGVGEPSVDGVVSELSGADCVESAETAEETGAGCEFVVDEGGYGAEDGQPGSLDVVHVCLIILS